LCCLALANVLVFGALGFFVLQRRIVTPLEQLAGAARQLGAEGRATAVEVEGPRETIAVATAFNEMSESLARRGKELEDAVVELRAANDDLRRTRAGLDRAERLASVGRLAAGVAHEVGNPLGAILALVELAARDKGLSAASREQLGRVQREGERVRAILRQLLDLARPLRARCEPLDLARVADETRRLVAAQRRYGAIEFSLAAEPDLPLALGDASAAAQVLLNLVLNAAEAVQGTERPRIAVTLRAGALLRRRGDADVESPARARRDAVECWVSDNGCGIAEEDRERVFDPFYTSRPPGEGTGLGLPNALRMAQEQGGTVELCEPPPGFATAFVFRLPAATRTPSAAVVRSTEAGP
jgi:signal transduction histidine kinase